MDLALVCRHQCLNKVLDREVFLVLQTMAQKRFIGWTKNLNKFNLEGMCNFLAVSIIKHCNTLPGEVADSSSFWFFKTRLAIFQKGLIHLLGIAVLSVCWEGLVRDPSGLKVCASPKPFADDEHRG